MSAILDGRGRDTLAAIGRALLAPTLHEYESSVGPYHEDGDDSKHTGAGTDILVDRAGPVANGASACAVDGKHLLRTVESGV